MRLKAVLLIVLVLSGILQAYVGSSLLIPKAYATPSMRNSDGNTIAYVDSSSISLGSGNYRYTTSFGVYDFTYQTTTKLYLISYKAPDGSVLVQASTYVLWENSTGSYLPVNLQPARFQIDPPTLVTTPLRFEADWPLSYYLNKAKTQTLGSLVLIVDFQKSAYPKQSVHLQLDSYQVDPKCIGIECARETYWNQVGLKDRYWSWLQAPADKTVLADGSENLKVSSGTWNTVATSESKQETLTSLASAKSLTTNGKIQFTSSTNWYADWAGTATQQTTLETSLSTKNLLSLPIVSTAFAVNMDYVDPTFGLTSTGSTSYPTAKAVTANGNAVVDNAQSKFGGTSGYFDGTGDYLSIPDSVDWYFGTGAFTVDFWVDFHSLPASNEKQDFYVQYVNSANYFQLELFNQSGTQKWVIYGRTGGSDFVEILQNAATLAVNTWYHVAFVRSGNSWYTFQDGTQCGSTGTDTSEVPNFAGSVYISTFDGATRFFNGWLDEFRVSKGVARWTSNFTPPTARYDRDSTTVLLLHNDGADASTTFLDDVTTGTAKATWFRLTDNNAAVSSVSFYTHTAGNYRVSIWNDTGATAPDNLLWESGDIAASATTWNNVTISAGTPASLTLQSGIVWLAWQCNPGAAYVAMPSYTAGSANNGTYLYQAYGAFPASWSGTVSAEKWSIFATYSTNQNFLASLSDSGDGSESVVRSLVQARSGASSGSGVESTSIQNVHARSLSDAGDGLISLIGLFAGVPIVSDSGSGQESLERLLAFTRTTTSAGSGLDLVSLLQAIQRSLSDLGSGLESIAALFAGVREITETGSGQESLTASRTLQRILSDTGSGLDSLIRQAIFERTVTEAGSGTEDANAQASLSRMLLDLGSGIDSLVRALPFQRINLEQGSGQDTLARLFGVTRNLSDAGAGLDSLVRQIIFGRTVNESGSGTENTSTQTGLSRVLSDLGSGVDSLIRALTFQRTNLDQGTGQDTLTRLFEIRRNLSDIGGGLDSVIRQVLFGRSATDSGSGSEDAGGQTGLSRMLSETGTGLEDIIRAITFGRANSEQGSGQDILLRIFAASRSTSDSGSGSESLTQVLGHTASLIIQGTGTETLSRLMTLTRSSSDTGIGTELLSRLFAATRSILDFGSAVETLTHLLTPYVPPSTSGAGGGVIIKPLPTTVMVGAVFPRSIYFLLPGARVSQDMTISNPSGAIRQVTVHYVITNVATGRIVYEDTVKRDVPKGSITYTVQAVVTETGRYRIDITAVDGGTATAQQEFDVGLWQIWQGPILLWSIIAFVGAVLVLFYRKIQEEW